MSWWRCDFVGTGTAVYLQAESEQEARIRAKLAAWSVSGKWWEVEAVRQEVPEEGRAA